jgi:hypothetical protein
MRRTIEYADAHFVGVEELRSAVDLLDAWCAAPNW